MLTEQSVQRTLTADEQLYLQETGQILGKRKNLVNDSGFKKWMKDLTDNILDGVFPRSGVEKDNQEALSYLFKHPTTKLKVENDILMLFKPIKPKRFADCLKTNFSKDPKNSNIFVKENQDLYINFNLLNIKDLESIFKTIDKIDTAEEVCKPYKISFDCGFVIEDSVDETYSVSNPSVDKLGRNIPMTIKGPADVQLFKHLVFSTLGEYTSEVHQVQGSRYHYVAMHAMLFQVTKLNNSGARVMVPGYDFLIKNKFIRDWGNDHELCAFNVVANN